jgi:hypothetical protein
MADPFPGSPICNCCGERLDAPNVATCGACGKIFHLLMRSDVAGRDCGAVWINEHLQALEFGCDRCLGRLEPDAPEPRMHRYARRQGSVRDVLAGRAVERRVKQHQKKDR